MTRARWHPLAVQDADDAAAWYAQHGGISLELSFIDALEATVGILERHPGAGSTRHADLLAPTGMLLRFHPIRHFDDYLVYYVEHAASIQVIRIWNARRGLDALALDAL
jgi:toxin ParE1/3/4